MKTCHLICNLESGKGIRKKEIDTIIELIKKYDYEVTLHITENQGDATSIVKTLKKCDLVLSIGGDGTFNEIVTGNYKRKNKLLLSHIPVGTTNDIGTMLGMNKNIIKNVKDILEGDIKQMDIGIINNQPFIYVAGFGKFINVPYETERKLKKSLGHLAYLINGFKEFFQITKLYDIEYEIDEHLVRGLDYYTYTVFEVEADIKDFGSNNVLCAGGRYNHLVENLDGPATPAVGFGLGSERLLLALEHENIDIVDKKSVDVYVIPMTDDKSFSFSLVYLLRTLGLSVETDYLNRKLANNFKYAEKINAKYTVVIGEDEIEKEYFTVKNMKTREEEKVSKNEFLKYILEQLEQDDSSCSCDCDCEDDCDGDCNCHDCSCF